ncbi:MAG: hypothetical protein ACLR0U_19625 [Enterocloster clostridioformis]
MEHTKEVIKGERERLSGALHDLGFSGISLTGQLSVFSGPEEDGTLEKGRLYQELLRRRTT